MKTLSKLFGVACVAMALAFVIVPKAQAQTSYLDAISISLSSPDETTTSSYRFNFSHNSTNDIYGVGFQWCTNASYGACAGKPTGSSVAGAGYTHANSTGEVKTNATAWTMSTNAGGIVKIGGGIAATPTDGNSSVMTITNVSNSDIADDCSNDANTTSDTCYVHITTFDDLALTNEEERGVGSYTVIANIDISATVDPYLTFVIGAVAQTTSVYGVTISETSTPTTLPFGNLTPGTPKYVGHTLTVTTNSNSGYNIFAKMTSTMVGSQNGANNIDPFPYAWGTTEVWAEPNGTAANVDTGWIGIGSTDSVTGANWASGEFTGFSTSDVIVSQETSSDDGSTSQTAVYAIEVNTEQPADTYSGTMLYTLVANY